jgi:putative membrane protein
MLVSAALALAVLAAGLWFSRFVSIAVAREDWMGWLAKGLALLIGFAVVALVLREVVGFLRLARLGRIRRLADRALTEKDIGLERRAVANLKHLAATRAEAKWALGRFRERERHRTQPGELIGLADSVLMAPSDRAARRVVFESARRVAVVTAVVPIAVISVLFVLFENVRMVRRLAAAYGGRPGFLGGIRLLWRVIAYVVASGAIALTDDLFGQFLGQDIVRRLSRRLGEGAFNGALTARLGVAAIDVCRPLPYVEASPLRARHVVSQLFPELSPTQLVGRAFGRSRKRGDADRVFPKRADPPHDQ